MCCDHLAIVMHMAGLWTHLQGNTELFIFFEIDPGTNLR